MRSRRRDPIGEVAVRRGIKPSHLRSRASCRDRPGPVRRGIGPGRPPFVRLVRYPLDLGTFGSPARGDLLELRHRERGRAQVLHRVRDARSRRACPNCGAAEPAGGQVLRRVRTRRWPRAPRRSRRRVAARRPARRPRTPVAERRLVSVLFADLVGFTPFAEERDAEEVRELADAATSSSPATSSAATAGRSRSSSATRSWPSGARRSRTRTTPSGPSAPASSSSTRCAPLGPGDPGARRRPDRRGGGDARRDQPGHGRRRPRQHGRAGSSRSRRPGTVLVGEATQRAASRRDRLRAGRRAGRSRARQRRSRRGGRCGSSPSAAGATGARRLEAPFVGRDDELRLLKDLFHATARESASRASSRSSGRPASARPASPGSS